ncbi:MULTISPECIES: hypothetical protein [unclassified Chryseobacterium]|uniref:hypothetical protein n=1 Tax=Chryseobacterium sp. R2A-55 TaxID=2744445 RepID=UPI001F3EF699|nr:hypothetical protein [Chryseobacterium sp. R2A-55]
MNPDRKNQLLAKRAQLQNRIRFNEFVENRIVPFLEILDELQNLEIEHSIISFRCIPPEFHELLRRHTQTEALEKYKLAKVEITTEDTTVETVLEKYPSINPFRYVLDASVVGYGNLPDEALQEIQETQQFKEEKVFVYWLKYAFLLEIDFKDLVKRANDDLFNSWHDDAVIFPKDYSWLIAYTIEDEWRVDKNK